MTLQESQLVDKYERLFAEAGWKELIDDLGQKREAIKDLLADTKTPFDQVCYERGRLEGYRYITSLEALVSQFKEQAANVSE